MTGSNNGQSSDGDCRKPKGNYTGERVKLLRPETYRRVVRLLAEPRQHISYREICRQCHVTDDTVRVIEQREAIPIAARKQTLMLGCKQRALPSSLLIASKTRSTPRLCRRRS